MNGCCSSSAAHQQTPQSQQMLQCVLSVLECACRGELVRPGVAATSECMGMVGESRLMCGTVCSYRCKAPELLLAVRDGALLPCNSTHRSLHEQQLIHC
jgi:hypothetical protein